jgi:hypothetical protein
LQRSKLISMDNRIRGLQEGTDIAEGKAWLTCDLSSSFPSRTVTAAVINPIML